MLAKLESRLNSGHWLVLSTLLFAVALLKGGFFVEVFAQEPDPAFPLPQPGITALSYGLPALVWAFGIQGNVALIGLMSLVLSVLAYFLSMFLVQRSFTGNVRTIAIISIALGPTICVLLGNIGRHDVFIILGAVVVGLRGERIAWALLGTLIMVLGNPEQSLVALLLALALAFTRDFKRYRTSLVLSSGVALVAFVTLSLWARSLGVTSRADWIGYHLGVGLLNFWANVGIAVYASYGLLWLLVIFQLSRLQGSERIVGLAALIILPLLVSMVTADTTRVFVGISTVMLMMAMRISLPALVSRIGRITTFPASIVLLSGLLLPSIEVFNGASRIPFRWIYEFITTNGIAPPLGIGIW